MAIDFNADQNRMGLALLAAAGPSARPMSFGQRMFMGMGQHDQYLREKEAQEMLRKRQATQELLIAAQMQEMQAQAEQRRAQVAAMQQKADAEKELAARQAAFLQGGMGTRTTPQQALAGGGGPTIGNAARLNERQPFDIEQAIALFGIDNAQKMAGAGDWGRPEVARVVNGMSGGREVAQQFDKFGRPVGTGMEQYRAPISVNQGNKTTFADPFSLKTLQEFQQFQSPDSVASNAVTMRGQNMVDGRERERMAWTQGGGELGSDPTQSALIKRFGKPEAGRRWKADGTLEPIPGGSADIKAHAGDMGKGSVNDVVASLRDMYNKLDESGDITNPEKSWYQNLWAGTASSGAGQTAGRFLGTQSQSLRNTIAQQRPLLLQAIMKATGMSAKQMDSNAELKLYLATATDPTLDVASNKRALDMIETLYGRPGDKTKPSVSNW